jgi:hypothetical protein
MGNGVHTRLRVPARHVLAVAAYTVFSVTTSHAAVPANDGFANAIELTPAIRAIEVIQVTGTIAGATVESGEENNADLAAYHQRGTIWWKWTCVTSSIVQFIIYSPTASLVAGAFEGTTVANLTTVSPPFFDMFLHPEMTFDAGIASFQGTPGKTYWFAVMPKPGVNEPLGGVEGNFTFFYVPPPPPPIVAPTNDHFANRIFLTGTNLMVEENILGATTEEGENLGPQWDGVQSTVWYSWSSPTNGVAYFSGHTPVGDYYFKLRVYQGESVNNLVPVSPTLDGGFLAGPNDRFHLQIGSPYTTGWDATGRTGSFTLSIRMNVRAPASSNDDFANRLDVTMPDYHFDGSIYNATMEPGEPIPSGYQQTLWWRLVCPGNGLLSINVSGPYAPLFTVYDGASFAAMIPVTARAGNRYIVEGGREYSIQVASGFVPSGGISMETLFRSASNDMFAGSLRLEGTNCTAEGDYIAATFEPGEPNPGATNTIWFSWAAPATGRVWYSPYTTWWRPGGVYSGYTLETLVPVRYGGGVGQGEICFLAEEGNVYHFQYAGENYEPLRLALRLEPFTPASNDDFANAKPLGWNFNFGSVLGATLEPGEPAHRGSAASKSIWWKWQAPSHVIASFYSEGSLVPDVVMAVYQGSTVDTLSLVAKQTNGVTFFAVGGQTYYIAAAVPEEGIGDVMFWWQMSAGTPAGVTPTVPVPGNLLLEPSWEGTFLEPHYWHISGHIAGSVNEGGGADGSTWPVLEPEISIWQDISVVPGHRYSVKFALSGALTGVQATWDGVEIGLARTPSDENYWHWAEFITYASNATARVGFKNLGGIFENISMDAFSVVDLTAAPAIVSQPASISAVAGGAAAFFVGASGSAPLAYQWFHDDTALAQGTSRVLTLESVAAEQAGRYKVRVSNEFGAVTSAVATLTVDAPTNATIVLQPYGDTIPVGGYFNASVAASGTPPLTYQWFFNGEMVADATNHNLVLPGVQLTNAGIYEVRVQNYGGIVWSLPARLVVTNAFQGGGTIDFRNRALSFTVVSNEAPVFDLDGITPLNGPEFVAQLYAGPSLESLRPIASASPFRTGYYAGYFVSIILTLPNVPPGGAAFAQVRVWEVGKGSSYEEARLLGRKFGRSEILQVTAGGTQSPTRLFGLASFNLQAGLPSFTVGVIEFVERQGDNTLVWSVRGESGFRYVVEKSTSAEGIIWRPFTILTNTLGTASFTDTADSSEGGTFYRARILD